MPFPGPKRPPPKEPTKPDHKWCTVCDVEKPLSEFYFYFDSRYDNLQRYRPNCKWCHIHVRSPRAIAWNKAYQKSEQYLAYQRTWQADAQRRKRAEARRLRELQKEQGNDISK
jgi:hypothetical protein